MNLLTCSKQARFVQQNCKKNTGMFTTQIMKAMKLTFILLTASFLQLSATGLSQNVTISLKDAPVEKFFEKLKDKQVLDFCIPKRCSGIW